MIIFAEGIFLSNSLAVSIGGAGGEKRTTSSSLRGVSRNEESSAVSAYTYSSPGRTSGSVKLVPRAEPTRRNSPSPAARR